MNPRLVAFLLASTLAGLAAASATLVAGWGVFAAFAMHGTVGSLTLLTTSAVGLVLDGGPHQPLPAVRRARV